MDKTRKYSKSAIFVWYEYGRRRLLGAQSINTEISYLNVNVWTVGAEKLSSWSRLTLRMTAVRDVNAAGGV